MAYNSNSVENLHISVRILEIYVAKNLFQGNRSIFDLILKLHLKIPKIPRYLAINNNIHW
jgi:hypothetical protein